MKNSPRLPWALTMVLILVTALSLGACSKPLLIDEDKESTAAAEVFTQFMLAMGEGNISQAWGFYASGSNVTAEGLASMLVDYTTMFTDIEKVEVSAFTITEDPDSNTKLRARLTGIIHYKDESRLFSAEMLKDSGTWFLVNVTFQN